MNEISDFLSMLGYVLIATGMASIAGFIFLRAIGKPKEPTYWKQIKKPLK